VPVELVFDAGEVTAVRPVDRRPHPEKHDKSPEGLAVAAGPIRRLGRQLGGDGRNGIVQAG